MKIKTTKNYMIEGKILLKGSEIEILDESKLVEMSKKWSDMKQDLIAERPVREEHLIKLFYYKDQPFYVRNFWGWCASAIKGFEHIPTLKSNGKYPKADDVYDEIWLSVYESFDDFHKRVMKRLNKEYSDYVQITDLQLDECREFVEKFNFWASEEMSKYGGVDIEDASDKIKELLDIE